MTTNEIKNLLKTNDSIGQDIARVERMLMVAETIGLKEAVKDFQEEMKDLCAAKWSVQTRLHGLSKEAR